jgi:hypothetical protein
MDVKAFNFGSTRRDIATLRPRAISLLGRAALVMLVVLVPAAAPSGGVRASTADHGTFEALDRKFASRPEVTRACLECHTHAAEQIHRTKH